MSPEIDSSPRKVWVLMFDRLQIREVSPKKTKLLADFDSAAPIGVDFGPFDALDLQSTFFEQYALQDTRDSAKFTGIPGQPYDDVRRFIANLRAANKSASHIRLVCVNDHTSQVGTTHSQKQSLTSDANLAPLIERTVASTNDVIDGFSAFDMHQDAELRFALTADLVWIDGWTEAAEDYRRAADRLLQLIQRLRSAAVPPFSALPILIVSAMRGDTLEVHDPFISGLAANQIHVPLWIDHGTGHACRIQALTGSNDLLPTMAEYLLETGSSLKTSVSVPENLSDQSVQLSSGPISLVSVCEHCAPLPDRLLRLRGDSWDALRTQQYLLVHPGLGESHSDSAQRSSGEEMKTTRRLYLKPDDVWNVNDAIVSYAAIADQMERMAAANDKAGLSGNPNTPGVSVRRD